MKWTEPWKESIKNQEPYNILSISFLKSSLTWTLALTTVVVIYAVVTAGDISRVFQNIWVFALIGFALSWSIYSYIWLSPIKVESGPKGIVRIKGETLSLFPWESISNYDIVAHQNFKKLALVIEGVSERVYFLIPDSVEIDQVRKEVRELADRG